MKITQYCQCGYQMELDFGKRFKRGKCPVCKTKFKYKESADGALTYIYKTKDLDRMAIQHTSVLLDTRRHDRFASKTRPRSIRHLARSWTSNRHGGQCHPLRIH